MAEEYRQSPLRRTCVILLLLMSTKRCPYIAIGLGQPAPEDARRMPQRCHISITFHYIARSQFSPSRRDMPKYNILFLNRCCSNAVSRTPSLCAVLRTSYRRCVNVSESKQAQAFGTQIIFARRLGVAAGICAEGSPASAIALPESAGVHRSLG